MTRYVFPGIILYAFLKNRSVKVLNILFVLFMVAGTLAHAEKQWYPMEVDVWQPPFNDTRQRVQKQYVPLDKAQKKWRISVFIPHLKDAYWIGVNYGFIDEARRLGVSLSIYEAGGYGQLEVQRRQIEDQLAKNPDGIIIGAISLDGLNDLVEKAHEQGIPIIDSINGMSSPQLTARVAADFRDLGYQAAAYLLRLQENVGKPMEVAWFPGPKGAGWVAAGDAGFNDAIVGSAIKILTTKFGDTGIAAQEKLVEAALDKNAEDLDFIVGTTTTAEAAVKILRRRALSDRIKVLSYYYGPGVHRGIRRGSIVASPTDHQVVQARIAVDVMVRILEKKDYFKHVAPRVSVVDRSNIKQWDSTTTLAPRGYRPIFSINE